MVLQNVENVYGTVIQIHIIIENLNFMFIQVEVEDLDLLLGVLLKSIKVV